MAVKNVDVDGKIFEISYELVNPQNDRQILFLHGWGSNKEVMKVAFGSSFKDFSLIFVDMPGFGKSGNTHILKTSDYALIMKKFLDVSGFAPFAIFGHSFGGKVATLLDPDMLCLLSSAGIVEKKPFKVRAKIRVFKFLKKFFGDSMYKLFATKDADGMPKNMYETLKNVVDEDFSSTFSGFKNRALIFWGIEDRATSLASGKKIGSLIQNSKFYDFDGDHYFFLKNQKQIEGIFLADIA